ncbi:MAG: hypothetical protein C0613_11570 [Desulfobulbaceae bacterium]|nr:MAG: hypothetical protein C0613_11570 [Desulfobulbaceae bacterium]
MPIEQVYFFVGTKGTDQASFFETDAIFKMSFIIHSNIHGTSRMNGSPAQQKPEINYPCHWQYKVIGTAKHEILEAIACVVGNREHTVCESRSSAKGTYLSMNVEVKVHSEDMRNSIFMELQRHPNLKMII